MRALFATLAAAVILSGCAVPKFDNVEYNHFVEFASWAKRAQIWCSEPTAMIPVSDELLHRARVIDIYATYRPHHKDIKDITALVYANAEELHKAYWSRDRGSQPTAAYCVGKLTIIENSLKRVLPVIGDLQE